jgi:2-dehydro-3-deoxyphosphooctonate aldolase (KDO 8-P synthase)
MMLTFPPNRLFLIAGTCVIESESLCLQVARFLKPLCDELNITYIFKASFDKANRSANASFRGPGLAEGLKILAHIQSIIGVPVLTDVHEPEQVGRVAQVVDILQVPAFLARQTDLLQACGRSGRAVNIKKGQFMSPQEMANAIEKVRSSQPPPTAQNPAAPILLTERGTFFGYNRLVNDFTGLEVMKAFNVPVVFDVTHSTQQPAGLGSASGGNPQYSPLLARAAIAAGVDGLFLECHPNPSQAKSDAATMLDFATAEKLLRESKTLFDVCRPMR